MIRTSLEQLRAMREEVNRLPIRGRNAAERRAMTVEKRSRLERFDRLIQQKIAEERAEHV